MEFTQLGFPNVISQNNKWERDIDIEYRYIL